MKEEVPWFASLIVAWLPFIIWIATTIWIGRRVGKSLRANDGRSVGQVIDDHAREMRRTNDMLEQMVKDHRARLETLEQRR